MIDEIVNTTVSEPNIPMLRKYVEWVEEQDALPVFQREWEQGTWALSPEAIKREGKVLQRRKEEGHSFYGYRHRLLERYEANVCGTAYCVAGRITADTYGPCDEEGEFYDQNGNEVDPSVYAREVLGLSWPQAETLFDADNSAADIRRLAERYAGERL